jgi:hypothetical protein
MDSRRQALCARKVSRRGIGERIGAGLQRMSVVASEPLPTDVELNIQVDELRPEVSVVEGRTTPISPSLATPAKDEPAHPLD